jgi:hypothetical protein
MRSAKWFTLVCCWCFLTLTFKAAGTTVTYQQGVLPAASYAGCADAHISMWGEQGGRTGYNNGNSTMLEEGDWSVGSGNYALNTDSKIILISFSLDGIPSNATVQQAKLRVYHYQNRQPTQATQNLYAARLLKAWGEGVGTQQDGRAAVTGEVTWYYSSYNVQRWQMGGARGPTDMAAPESSAGVAVSTLNTWVEWDVTQMARAWVQNPASNFGLKLSQDPAVGTSATMWVRGLPGFYSSEWTTANQRPTLVVGYSVVVAPPAAPTGLTGQSAGGNSVVLNWADNASDEQGFKIERKTGAGSYAEITQVAANTTSYRDSGLTVNTTYSYRVRAFNSAGDSAYSNEVSVPVVMAMGVRDWRFYQK